MHSLFDALGADRALLPPFPESHGVKAHVNPFACGNVDLVIVPRAHNADVAAQVLNICVKQRPPVMITRMIHAVDGTTNA